VSDLLPSAETVADLTRLIGFDTTTRGPNLDLIAWAAERLEGAGARLRYDYSPDRTKANLLATFGEGPGGVVLSGHTDVVSVAGQAWTTDPFTADVRDGRLYGRGACDMKAFVAVVLAKAERFGRTNLREPIHCALTYDEEVGCLGVPGLLRDMQSAGIKPSGCIVGEPTDMRVIDAHKGGRIYRCCLTGIAAHSSLTPHGVNAIEYAARVIAHIQELAEREERDGIRGDGYDVPFSTISTNMIQGGNGMNIIPTQCEFVFDYRYLPGVAPDHFIGKIERFAREQILPRMQVKNPKAGIRFECVGEVPALNARETDDILRLAVALAGNGERGKVAYGTEGSFFQEIGIPAIVCGPGSINQAHQPDEYVELEQLALCERFIDRLVDKLAV
jgi:acetylornithine deacetylase